MFKIKICGITTPEDALLAADAGAEAIGINFYPQSRRYVKQNDAQRIRRAVLPGSLRTFQPRVIGIYVNATHEYVVEHSLSARVADYQFHGDEPPKTVAAYTKARICEQVLPVEITDQFVIEQARSIALLEPSDPDPNPMVIRAFRPLSNSLDFVA